MRTLDSYGINPMTIFQYLDGLSTYLNSYLLRTDNTKMELRKVPFPDERPMG